MDTTTITFDQLPHVVSGLSEKLDRVLELLEKPRSEQISSTHFRNAPTGQRRLEK